MATDVVPEGYTLRPATLDDVPAIARLVETCEIAELGRADQPVSEITIRMTAPEMELATDSWNVYGPDGALVAHALHAARQHFLLGGNVSVAPEHQGRGLGALLLRRKEARAQAELPLAPPDKDVVIYQFINDANTRALELLAVAGYAPVRHFWRMEIDLLGKTFAPTPVPGVTIRAFDPDRDARPVFDAMEEAFLDHWGHIRGTYDEFAQYHLGDHLDPTLWAVAEADGQIAGALIGAHDLPGYGFVGTLGVRRPWRGRGLAMALLQTAFAAFQRAGKAKVGLGVDAASLTGATRLYERAGMRVAWQSTIMQKELRPALTQGSYES